jgi:hypothetical protein
VSPLFDDPVHYDILLFGLPTKALQPSDQSLLPLAERVDQVRNLRSRLLL